MYRRATKINKAFVSRTFTCSSKKHAYLKNSARFFADSSSSGSSAGTGVKNPRRGFYESMKGAPVLTFLGATAGVVTGMWVYDKYITREATLPASSSGHTSKPGDTPGEHVHMKKMALDMASDMSQAFAPLKSIHLHLCGFHFYNGELGRQVEAHHYCSHINDDVHQCLIYDSDRPDARLIGIEYIISEKIFNNLPKEEKKYWHSHVHEVTSGLLIAPRQPERIERAAMADYVNTYGKTVHLWQVDRGDVLPLGPPKLMMAFTEDGQVDPNLIKKRDKQYGIDTNEIRERRKSIPRTPVAAGADSWQKGEIIQFEPSVLKK